MGISVRQRAHSTEAARSGGFFEETSCAAPRLLQEELRPGLGSQGFWNGGKGECRFGKWGRKRGSSVRTVAV